MAVIQMNVLNLDPAMGFALSGGSMFDNFGGSISSAGDFNNDGFGDFIVGALGVDYPSTEDAGAAFVYFGSAGGPQGGFEIAGQEFSDGAGTAVSGGGDVNGDGIDDIIVGVPDLGNNVEGGAYVVFGSAVPLSSSFDPATLNGRNGFIINGAGRVDLAGASLAIAGDINGDGAADIIIGAAEDFALGEDPPGGDAYVVFGRPEGGFPDAVDLDSLDGINGFQLTGAANFDWTGWSVSGAGDVDGDGLEDLVVGAIQADPGGKTSAGAAYVVFGRDTGFAAVIDLGSLSGSDGFRIAGLDPGDNLGNSVASAGDFNGDGIDDLIVGSFRSGTMDEGAVYLIYGKAGGGFSSSLDVASLDGSNGFKIVGTQEEDFLGRSVSGAGDINNDGFDDVLFVRADADDPQSSYVLFGTAEGFAGEFDLGELTNPDPQGDTIGVHIFGSGGAVAAAGDINGDGYADILLGDGNAGAERTGAVYVIYGSFLAEGGNAAPVAVNDLATVNPGGSITLDILANDSEPDGDPLTVTVGAPASGSVVLNLDNTVTYTAAFGGDGIVTFHYTISDGFGGSDTATVAVKVRQAPAAQDDRGATEIDTPLVIDVLANDTDANADVLTISAVGPLAGGNGTVAIDSEGTVTFTPSAGFTGSDSFEYTVSDGEGGSDTGKVTVSVYEPAFVIDTGNLGGAGFTVQGGGASSQSPRAGASAGDINHDGFDDFLVSAPGFGPGGNSGGRVFVVYGEAEKRTGTLDLDSFGQGDGFVVEGGAQGDYLGTALTPASDINGDGIDDFAAGAPNQDENGIGAGAIYVIFGQQGATRADIALENLPTASGFAIYGEAVSDFAPNSLSSADVNGDGRSDLIIGVRNNDVAGNRSGKVYVIFGKDGATRTDIDLDSLAASDGFSVLGSGASAQAGQSVSSAGDFNSDGFEDFIIGASGETTNDPYSGAAYLIYGKQGETRADLDLANLSASDGFQIAGDGEFAFLGGRVAGGDVDGDGYSDLIVSAIGASEGGPDDGTVYVIFGEAGTSRPDVDVSQFTAEDGFRIFGKAIENPEGGPGFVASAGDFNGDGLEDILLGAPGYGAGDAFYGEAYLIFGKPDQLRADIYLDNLSFDDGIVILGNPDFGSLGGSIASAGDLNNDGYDDIIVVAPPGGGAPGTGEAYVIYGGPEYGAPFNARPTAVDDTATLDEDTSVVIDVLANDSDPEGDAIAVTAVGVAANGTVVNNGDGTVTYVPDANFSGTETFTYSVSDATGSSTATVTVTVNPMNDAPVALGDAVSLDEDGDSVAIDVVANDTDADGDTLTVTGFTQATNGSVGDEGDGSFTYTPDPDFTGTDSFTYTISDGNGGTDTATVTVTINPVNDAPVANDDALFASIDTARNYAATVLLANDSDIDGDALTITSVQGALNGTVALDGTTVTFTPEAGFTGAASFTYTVSDGNGGSDTASVAVTVTEGNQPPVAPATQAATTLRGAAILVEVGASDPDGDVLTYGVSGAVNGTASVDEDGLVMYTPDAGFTGSETLVVTIDDGNGGSASQEIALTVSALPAANQFRLFASDGFAGAIGGSGAVIGTGGFQDIAVLDVAGTVSFDPSFNQGDDIVRLSGDADDWYVSKSGSSAIFTDGDTFVQLAVGPAGMAVVFDDGARTLRLDVGGGGAFLIGDQVFTATLARVDAAPDGTVLPGGADAQASARLFLAEDGGASAAGKVNVIGTGGAEIATLLSGTITLDPSFNKGGDVIRVDEAAEDFLASKSGSSALLVGSDTTLLVPVGLAGATLAFGDGSDTRELLLSIEPNGITIDEQFFGVDPVRLMAAV